MSSLPPRRGRFSSSELRRLRAAISDVLSARHISGGFCTLFSGGDGALKGVWSDIATAAALEGRSRQSVYEAAKTHFDDRGVGGVWSAHDVSALASCVERYGRRWRRIGNELGRRPRACRDKWRLIGGEFASGRWTKEEDEKLLAIIRRTRAHTDADTADTDTGADAADASAGAVTLPKSDIMWTTVSALMETRSHSQCRNRYFTCLLPALQSGGFGAVLAWNAAQEDRLVDAVYEQRQAETVNDVDWQRVAQQLAHAFTASACQAHFRHIIRPLNAAPNALLTEIAQRLRESRTLSVDEREVDLQKKRRRRLDSLERRVGAADTDTSTDATALTTTND